MAKQNVRACMSCGGSGRVTVMNKKKQEIKTCSACNGSGRVVISTI